MRLSRGAPPLPCRPPGPPPRPGAAHADTVVAGPGPGLTLCRPCHCCSRHRCPLGCVGPSHRTSEGQSCRRACGVPTWQPLAGQPTFPSLSLTLLAPFAHAWLLPVAWVTSPRARAGGGGARWPSAVEAPPPSCPVAGDIVRGSRLLRSFRSRPLPSTGLRAEARQRTSRRLWGQGLPASDSGIRLRAARGDGCAPSSRAPVPGSCCELCPDECPPCLAFPCGGRLLGERQCAQTERLPCAGAGRTEEAGT